jgi:hypothetical protein
MQVALKLTEKEVILQVGVMDRCHFTFYSSVYMIHRVYIYTT